MPVFAPYEESRFNDGEGEGGEGAGMMNETFGGKQMTEKTMREDELTNKVRIGNESIFHS